ncbi:MAG: hypothetical protein ACI80V_001201 [Rhodothermales bacterium]|jgi:hypothetical protein
MTDHVRRLLVRELSTFVAEIEAMPSDSLLWECPPGVSNPVGTLALHVAGNLRHFIGAGLGQTGYVRDRAREFEARGLGATDVIMELRLAIADMEAVLPGVAPDRLETPYPVAGVELPTGLFLLHLCSHAAHHLGQAGYLRRILTGENRSVAGASIPALVR